MSLHNYISTGYTYWKDACGKFQNHEASKCHKDALLTAVTLPATTPDIDDCLSSQVAKEKLGRDQCFLKILSNLKLLTRQDLALRGDGDERHLNFNQLLRLRGEDDSRVLEWLERKTDKYASPEMQNEIIKLMARKVLNQVVHSLCNAPYFTIMVDETTITLITNKLLYAFDG